MITNILLSTLFACSVVTSASINNYDYQKHNNAVNENAFVLDDNNYFITNENVLYRYNALINKPQPAGRPELLDDINALPTPIVWEPILEFNTNKTEWSQYIGTWLQVNITYDDDNNPNYTIILRTGYSNNTIKSVDGYTFAYEGLLRPGQWYTMRFYKNIDYDEHKQLFNSMTDSNGNALNRQFKPIIELGILNNYFVYDFDNAFQIKYSYPNDDIYNGTFNSLYFDHQSIDFKETNGTETINEFQYENYYSDELDILSAYYPIGDEFTFFDFTNVYYVSIGSMLYSFFENYIFLKLNENYKNDLFLDLEKYFYYADGLDTTEFDEIDINYIYNDMHFNVIDIYINGNSYSSMQFSIFLKDTTRNLTIKLIDYDGTFNLDDFLNYLNQNNLPKELLLKIDTSLNSGSFNFIRTLNIIQLGEENKSDIGIFNIFDLLSGGLLGIGAILSVMVLPGITIGMLLFLPFLALILFFIISLFKR